MKKRLTKKCVVCLKWNDRVNRMIYEESRVVVGDDCLVMVEDWERRGRGRVVD